MTDRGPAPAATDEELVAEYQKSPESAPGRAAAGILIERWSGRVYAWAFRVVRDHDRALDLAQDSLLKMYEALPRYVARGRFSAWLFTIVHHRCVSEVRKRPLLRDPEIDADSLGGPGLEPAAEYESGEERRRVFEAMEHSLDNDERAALWLRGWEGMSVEDITRVMRLDGSSGARGLLQRARRKLRQALEDPHPPREENR
ncbi:MAG TPA: sigma-70 family RNA polymerase sigma factor [Candidatus Sulfotelmatobacter sp.]|nr:sigma-70 family RNA polymerase sigma factor [Candidatus Sulfotelmatobacter sp.]